MGKDPSYNLLLLRNDSKGQLKNLWVFKISADMRKKTALWRSVTTKIMSTQLYIFGVLI